MTDTFSFDFAFVSLYYCLSYKDVEEKRFEGERSLKEAAVDLTHMAPRYRMVREVLWL